MRCGQGTLLRCQEACGALLNCGEHACIQVCHHGACQPCQIQVQQGESGSAQLTENNRILVSVVIVYSYFQCVTVALPIEKPCVGQRKRDLTVPDIFPVENSARCKCEQKV